MDLKKPVTDPKVLEAIHIMRANNTPETRSQMVHAVMQGRFLAPVHIEPEPQTDENGCAVLTPDATVGFHMLPTKDGQRFLLAFTDWDELKKWKPAGKQQVLTIGFDEYSRVILRPDSVAAGFVINPFGVNVSFNKNFLASVQAQKGLSATSAVTQQTTIPSGTSVKLGQPQKRPDAMLQAVSAFLAERDSVRAAYLGLIEMENQTHYLIAVDLEGDCSGIFQGIAAVAKPYLGGVALDMVTLENSLGKEAAKQINPFYQKNE